MKILSLHYLPNIQWMRHFVNGDCIIDVNENFTKQTYRNRATILGANGLLNLTIPIKKSEGKMLVKNLAPDHEVSWQKQHWESIVAAYGSTPYFIHYADEFKRIYEKPVLNIADFEMELLRLIMKYMKINPEIKLSEVYVDPQEGDDLRKTISPKVVSNENFSPYLQIFSGKFPFQPNLSIIDALFNLGPRTVDYL